ARPDLFRLPMPPQRTLCSLTRNVADIEDKTAVILLAIEKIPDDKRRAFLDKTLSDLFSTNEYQCEEPFIAALISAGADANAVVHGAPGMPLAWAVTSGYPQAIVRLLHDHGASFEDALLRIQTRTYWDEGNRRELAVHKLKAYREAITGAPAGEESELRQEIAQLRAEIAALREEITRRLPVTDTPAANKARKPKSGGAQPSP
ncbi:MAG: hypothetical protein KGQ70_04135, partial [Alphaproteobacteria bacterium]|nr:hypothetical protein [Alphaproteobacteria bacterium]